MRDKSGPTSGWWIGGASQAMNRPRNQLHQIGMEHKQEIPRTEATTDSSGLAELNDHWHGYGSIPISTIFRGMNIHKSQLFWCELQGYYWFWHTATSRWHSNLQYDRNVRGPHVAVIAAVVPILPILDAWDPNAKQYRLDVSVGDIHKIAI